MEIDRIIDLKSLLEKKSFFLFGPRATGKSTLVHRQLSDSATIIDLLDSRLFLRLSAAPQDLEAIIDANDSGLIVIIRDFRTWIEGLLNSAVNTARCRYLIFLTLIYRKSETIPSSD
jgi:uncharacterized protein